MSEEKVFLSIEVIEGSTVSFLNALRQLVQYYIKHRYMDIGQIARALNYHSEELNRSGLEK